MPRPLKFQTSVSGETERGIELRGQLLSDLVEESDFISTFFLSLAGRKPTAAELKLLNAIMVASFTHGLNAASGFVPRVVAASGNEILHCMATTLLALGPYHGGAITGAMKVFYEIANSPDVEKKSAEVVRSWLGAKKRLPGYGHPVYKYKETGDPRSRQLFAMARATKFDPVFLNISEMVEDLLEKETKKVLVLNVDGAVAALLCGMGFDAKAGNAVFGVARVAGSVAHIVEEQNSGEWIRRLDEGDVEYTG